MSSQDKEIRSQCEGGKSNVQTRERPIMTMNHTLYLSYVLLCKNDLNYRLTGFHLHFLLFL